MKATEKQKRIAASIIAAARAIKRIIERGEPCLDGAPLHPYHYGTCWSACAKAIGFPEITFHALRHTHVSQLVDQGVDIVTISRRIGHANPEITLRSYSHLFRRDDGKASEALNAIFKTVPA